MQLETTWNIANYDISDGTVLGLEPLRWLSVGKIAVVSLRGLLGAGELDAARRQAHELLGRTSAVNGTNGSQTTVGPSLTAHLHDPHTYFDIATRANEHMARAGFDLPARVRAALCRTFGLATLEPARGPDGRPYGEAVIRLHADGVRNPLHSDHIARDATGTAWTVADVVGQLSCVVCLQECDWGGELVTYRKPWEPGDEQWKVPGGPGYHSEVVATAPRHVFRPQTQDVYLINPTYYHEIEKPHGATRTTLGFFIGFTDDTLHRAVAWG
ncbi:2OG-Fe(II)-dependent halogenase WelO5 family protein [Streptomyces capitiformicae]|uniref:Prolyl 4-hydroxylase alpha subunit Fe(2+) 2OG dioxygenase domain-containing protein n=1 Tax=Streptomyces capitiformicae TaxID=2014920 RepID=A0A919DPW5_9ACTN|nr:hypothetical protein [Streptomyces capitiformicae]GHE67733.1 hypothetical protein GCM10017771_91440 [Streptomyces capitiformicae]